MYYLAPLEYDIGTMNNVLQMRPGAYILYLVLINTYISNIDREIDENYIVLKIRCYSYRFIMDISLK